MAVEFKVNGLEQTLARMQALPKHLVSARGGPARAALRKGAVVIQKDAKARAPVASGFMRDQIAVRRDGRPHLSGATEHYWVGVKLGKARRYANTKRNRGRARVGKTYMVEGNAYYWKFWEFGFTHPKTGKQMARPFLRPAFESKKEEAVGVIVTELNAGLDRIVKKLGGRA